MSALLLALLLALGPDIQAGAHHKHYTYQLNGDSIAWPSRGIRNMYTHSGRYIARNIIPTRMQTKGFQAILVFPRLRPGVPITLGKVHLKFSKSTPDVEPFPNWELQEEGNKEAIQSAVDLSLDQKGVLWVLDTGVVSTMDLPVRKGRPKIWAFQVHTGKLVRVIDLSSVIHQHSRLQYIIADVDSDGRQFLYVSDAYDGSVIVWDLVVNTGLRVSLPGSSDMGPIGSSDTLYIFMIRSKCGSHLLGFTYLRGRNVYAIPCQMLQRGQCEEIKDLGVKPGEIIPLGTDNGSVVFFRHKDGSRIFQWDADSGADISGNSPVQQENDNNRLCVQVAGGSRRLMWALDSNFQDFIHGVTGCVGVSVTIHPLVKDRLLL